MSHQKDEYRKIAKGTAILGGVQVFNIVIGIIKSKVAAIFLGAEGIGVFGLFTSVIDLVRNITGLGLNTSAVREISYHREREEELTRTVNIVRRLCWLTGLLGMLAMIIMAPWLSQWTFDSTDYTISFMILSVMPLFQALSFGQLSVLQGLSRLQYLAKVNLYGGLGGLIFLIPLYWWFGIDGIIPFMIIASIITLCCSYYFSHKLRIRSIILTFKQTCTMGVDMIKLGILLTLTAFLTALISYVIKVYIKNNGGLVDVGLYTASSAIFVSYIGLVFTAMGTDFFPRLSAMRDNSTQMGEIANRQAEISVLILTPMVVAFMLFSPQILSILYSENFTAASQMLRWSMLGVLLQASSYPLAFVILAKANNKVYLLKELGSGTYLLVFSILGYKYFGLTGIGVAYLCMYICALIQNTIINKCLYGISLSREYFKILIPNILLCVLIFVLILFFDNTIWTYIIGVLILGGSVWNSYRELNKRIGIKEIILKRLKK